MPRARLYASNAERQAAYRARLAQRHALVDSGGLAGRLAELETALAAANRRVDAANVRAARAERRAAAARDRYDALVASRPARIAGALGWAEDRVVDQLVAANQRIAELQATVAELQHRLASTDVRRDVSGAPGSNRASRRAAERDRRRRGH